MPDRVSGFRLSPLARTDLEDIWLYTFKRWSLDQADRYHKSIMAAIEGLTEGSLTGRATDIREGYLKYAVGAHFVFYRYGGDSLDVIRILHQRMDVGRHL